MLTNCVLRGNAAQWGGGGAAGGTLYNCTLTGNSAGWGGGAYGSTLYNCTMTGNSATGAPDASGGGAAGGTLYNCIVYYNSAPNGPNYSDSTFHSSCTTPLPDGEGNIDAEPLFMNRAAGDLRLRYGSPAIDAGKNLSELITADLDGNPRPLDGNWDGIAAFDMGAYEYHPQTADSNVDGIPDSWCHHYGLNPTQAETAGGNPDNDSQTTYQEWTADTDPTDEMSCFHIDHIDVGLKGITRDDSLPVLLESCLHLAHGP